MTHSMKLAHSPFMSVKLGKKTVEMRLFDEKRQLVKSGDTIEFTDTDTLETLLVTVKRVRVFDSFSLLYNSYPKTAIGYTESQTADPEDMKKYYPEDMQKKYRAAAIEIALK